MCMYLLKISYAGSMQYDIPYSTPCTYFFNVISFQKHVDSDQMKTRIFRPQKNVSVLNSTTSLSEFFIHVIVYSL